MVPSEPDGLLCNGWAWDPVLRELRHYPRKGKGWGGEPDGVERLALARSVTWHRWAQAPMASATGRAMPGVLSRIVVEYEGGANLTLNENDRECAGKLAKAIAEAYGLEVQVAGAPDGRRPGNLPKPDALGRLLSRRQGVDVALDPAAGEITVRRRRLFFLRSRRRHSISEVRRLELSYEVRGPWETFTVWAIVGIGDERLPLASYTGYEGWADPEEWRVFTQDLARSLGVEARILG